MSLAVLGTVYPVIFISELPDKTMFASLVLATRGRALTVWAGAAIAFAVHVCIAVTVGAALFTWLPERAVQALAAALFLVGAALAFRGANSGLTPREPNGAEPGAAQQSAAEQSTAEPGAAQPGAAETRGAEPSAGAGLTAEAAKSTGPTTARNPVAPQDSSRRLFLTTFVVVFLAEWGDLTQILTASMAARFHAPLAVGIGAGLALWSVAALAVIAGRPLRRLPAHLVLRLTAIVLLVLAAFAVVAAATSP
jgi:putative Ca2+/H+ antiporter (TMEM165/GDT1 family)